MPLCTIETNLAADAIPADFPINFTKKIALTFGKPEANVGIILRPGTRMVFGGSEAPVAVITLVNIGNFSEQANPDYAQTLMDFLIAQLTAIAAERIKLVFEPLAAHNAASKMYMQMKH